MHSAAPVVGSELPRAGRYVIFDEIGSGGMATVHLGLSLGSEGFSRAVAIKRMHAHVAREPGFASMFLDEARLAARIRHPNVVATLDVASSDEGLFHVLELVIGVPLARLWAEARRRDERPDPRIAFAIASAMLHGLHAAHEAKSEGGEPLGLVHRDVSPQNVIVGAEGVARVLDFGVAKARTRSTHTREGQLKGKLAYMSPEQIARGSAVDRRSDVFAAGIVVWELLTSARLFSRENEAMVLNAILAGEIDPPSSVAADVAAFDDVVMTALAVDPDARYPTARAMALALERACPLAAHSEVAAWVEHLSGPEVARLAARVEKLEKTPLDGRVDAAFAAPDGGRERSRVVASDVVFAPRGDARMAAAEAATASLPSAPRRPPRRLRGAAFVLTPLVCAAVVVASFIWHPSDPPDTTATAAAAGASARDPEAVATSTSSDAVEPTSAEPEPPHRSNEAAVATRGSAAPRTPPKRHATSPGASATGTAGAQAKRPSDFGF